MSPHSLPKSALPDAKLVDELMSLFVQLLENMDEVERRPKTFDTGIPLHQAETHTLEAIGANERTNVTTLARELGVTKGAVSQMLARLERKGLVRKASSPHSRREVVVELTPLGRKGFHAHRAYHAQMLEAVRDYFGPEPTRRLKACIAAVKDLIGIVQAFEARVSKGG